MCRTSSPSSVGKRRCLPRRRAPAKRRPSSAASGGSKVFSVATCAGPARSISARRGRARRASAEALRSRELGHGPRASLRSGELAVPVASPAGQRYPGFRREPHPSQTPAPRALRRPEQPRRVRPPSASAGGAGSAGAVCLRRRRGVCARRSAVAGRARVPWARGLVPALGRRALVGRLSARGCCGVLGCGLRESGRLAAWGGGTEAIGVRARLVSGLLRRGSRRIGYSRRRIAAFGRFRVRLLGRCRLIGGRRKRPSGGGFRRAAAVESRRRCASGRCDSFLDSR